MMFKEHLHRDHQSHFPCSSFMSSNAMKCCRVLKISSAVSHDDPNLENASLNLELLFSTFKHLRLPLLKKELTKSLPVKA